MKEDGSETTFQLPRENEMRIRRSRPHSQSNLYKVAASLEKPGGQNRGLCSAGHCNRNILGPSCLAVSSPIVITGRIGKQRGTVPVDMCALPLPTRKVACSCGQGSGAPACRPSPPGLLPDLVGRLHRMAFAQKSPVAAKCFF